jgi:hypothetical protein
MKYLNFFKAYKEKKQKKLEADQRSQLESQLKEYGIKNYTINNDGSIDVDMSVDLSHRDLDEIPFNFNHVNGHFDCGKNKLTSLKGAPNTINGDFYCSENELTNLKGSPQKGVYVFRCSDNKLNSLIGSPTEVEGHFMCSDNKLTNLIGSPKKVERAFDCCNNQLISLQGAPKEIGLDFICNKNSLPKEILDNLYRIKDIIKYQDDYFIWNSDGSLNKYKFRELLTELSDIKKIVDDILGPQW